MLRLVVAISATLVGLTAAVAAADAVGTSVQYPNAFGYGVVALLDAAAAATAWRARRTVVMVAASLVTLGTFVWVALGAAFG